MKPFLLLFIVFLSLIITSSPVTAQPDDPLGLTYGQYTKLGDDDIRLTVAEIIRVALGLLGITALVLIIYAGFKWMTAGGNEEGIESARKILFAAVIGLAIILSAYAITNFVVKSLYQATTSQPYGTLP